MTRSEIAQHRLAAGYPNAAAAATDLGVSRIHLLEIEEGRGSPSNSLLERMAERYGRSAKTLQRALKAARIEHLERELARLRK